MQLTLLGHDDRYAVEQLQMSLFALYSILDSRTGDKFRQGMHSIMESRLQALWQRFDGRRLRD